MSQNRVVEVVPTRSSPTLHAPDRALSAAARTAVAAGVPDSTRAAYSNDFTKFKNWCEANDRSPLPATAETLTEYAAHLAYRDEPKPLSPGSIERVRSAIRSAHRAAGLEPPDSIGLAKVVKGYRARLAESRDPRAKPRKATAATKDTLTQVIAGFDLATPAGVRDAAIWLLGFSFAGRRSEIASLDIEDAVETDEGLTIKVYRKKGQRFDEIAVPFAENPALCPVLAVMRWKACLANHGRTSGALFVRINRHGHIGPNITRDGRPIGDPTGRMTAQAISQVITRSAGRKALTGRWSGHSVRRGFATEARKAGHDRIRIARQGGWSDNSTALAGYMEDADRWTDNALKGVL
ncbi:site-specific integrase [Thermomonospora umbrina]|uniref:Site-specific recombinase XerD n=1 Tax=Thermomonospora umbrina TaxID=111806 RepID=A0A3D9T1V4_9ACTN|nr:site-specific integrase [Thermomonospora umbrina]REF00314.1 site-specific recombinase XerD [Thermomonospora umbrina]